MKPMRLTTVLVVGLALTGSGCASLRPPAGDKEALAAQQKQEEARQESAMENDPVGMSLYYAVELASLFAK
jgi:hypothetical protein